MHPDEKDDPVWDLLSRAEKPAVDPFFARNVVRKVRLMESDRAGFGWGRRLFSSPSLAVFGGAAVVAVIATVIVSRNAGPVDSTPVSPIVESSDFDPEAELRSVEYLGQLMAVADPDDLSDEAFADFLF